MNKLLLYLFFISCCFLNAQNNEDSFISFKLKNEIDVVVIENHENNGVFFKLTLVDSPFLSDNNREFIAQLTQKHLDWRSTQSNNGSIKQQLYLMGANYKIKNGNLEIRCNSKYTTDIISLIAQYYNLFGFSQQQHAHAIEMLKIQTKLSYLSTEKTHNRVSQALLYGKKHPYGIIEDIKTLEDIKTEKVDIFYKKHIYPNGAKLLVAGDINSKTIKKQLEAISKKWRRVIARKNFNLPKKKNEKLQFSIVDDASKRYSLLRFQKKVPISSNNKKNLLSLELVSYLLAKNGEGILQKTLELKDKTLFNINCDFNTNNYDQVFTIDLKIANNQIENSVQLVLNKLQDVIKNGVPNNELEIVKQKLSNKVVFDMRNNLDEFNQLYTKFDNNAEKNKLGFLQNILTQIKGITTEDINKALTDYIELDYFNIIITGDAKMLNVSFSNVIFDNDTIPMRYYDKYAKLIENPIFARPIPEGITIGIIMNNYIRAVGGRAALKKVKTLHTFAETNVREKKLTLDTKILGQDKYKIDFKINGRLLNFQIVNGNKGYMINQPLSRGGYMVDAKEKSMLAKDDIDNLKRTTEMFYEQFYKEREYKAESVETINEKDYYVVRVNDYKKAYYDIETGLKFRDVIKESSQGNTGTSIKYYDDYRDINGVKIPFLIRQVFNGNQFIFKIKQAEINKNVSEETDFKILDI